MLKGLIMATIKDFYVFVKEYFPEWLEDNTDSTFVVLEENIEKVYEASFKDEISFSILNTTRQEYNGYTSYEVASLELDIQGHPKARDWFTLCSVSDDLAEEFLVKWLNKG